MKDFADDFKALRRPREGRVVFGLCRAIALQFGIEVLLVRALFAVCAVLVDEFVLVYLVALWLIPAAPKISGMRTRRDKRQLLGFVLLCAATDQMLARSFSNNRPSAVLLIVAGLVIIHFRGRQLERARFGLQTAHQTDQFAGGWTNSESAVQPPVPPRWGLAGEVLNPQLWSEPAGSPSSAPSAPSASSDARPSWRGQFGNVALVTLIGVLVIGVFTQNSRYSPVNRAVEQQRVGSEPVVLRTEAGVDRLEDLEFGDGSFVVDASQLQSGVDGTLELTMGSGRLELILPKGSAAVGSVSQADGGLVVVKNEGKQFAAGTVDLSLQFARENGPEIAASLVTEITAEIQKEVSSRSAVSPKQTIPRLVDLDITAATASVCIRTVDHPEHCSSTRTK